MRKQILVLCILGNLLLSGCAAGSANSKNNSGAIAKGASPSAVQLEIAVPDASHVVKMRVFLVLLDSSRSYKDYEAAIAGLLSAVRSLGPGDRFVIARINGHLDPKDLILIDSVTKTLPNEIFTASMNIDQWRNKRRALDAAWQRTAENVRTISLVLQRLRGANTMLRTDVHGGVKYSASWLNSQPGDEKYLIVCSDLEHDTGSPTFAPPAGAVEVSNLRVKLHFISYKDDQHWKTVEAAWSKYFSRAAGFEILDSGRSTSAEIVPLSVVPRQLPNPLQTRSVN